MSYSRRSRYSQSPSPFCKYRRSVSRSVSRSRSLSRSRSRSYDSSDAENPGNNLYVTGLSARVTKRDLEKHFSSEGTVEEVHLVVDPWKRECRGFGFVTMSTVKEADRSIKYLNHSVLEGRVITVEKARRRRGRTPTPGRYLGLRTIRARRCSPSYSPYSRSRSGSPRYSSDRYRSRSSRRRSYSPYYRRRRSYSGSRSPYSRSPISRRDRSYSPYDRDYSPDDRCYRGRRNRPISRSISPRSQRYSRRSYSRSPSPRRSRRSYSRSMSPRRSRRSYSRSVSPPPRGSRRSYSRSISPSPKKSTRGSVSRGSRGSSKRALSRDNYSSRSKYRSWSTSASSRSVTPQSSSH